MQYQVFLNADNPSVDAVATASLFLLAGLMSWATYISVKHCRGSSAEDASAAATEVVQADEDKSLPRPTTVYVIVESAAGEVCAHADAPLPWSFRTPDLSRHMTAVCSCCQVAIGRMLSGCDDGREQCLDAHDAAHASEGAGELVQHGEKMECCVGAYTGPHVAASRSVA